MDMDEGQYITSKMVGLALTLQETISLPPVSPHSMPTPQHYLSLAMPRNILEQLEIVRSQVTAADKERAIHGSLQNISNPASA